MKKLIVILFVCYTTFCFAQWIQIGSDINGVTGDLSGISVSLNSDGTIVAIGAPGGSGNDTVLSRRGEVKVYENIGGNWLQLGNTIIGDAPYDFFGWSVSLNDNGNVIAIGAPENDGNDTINSVRGQVKVYENSGNNWVQIGNDIFGDSIGDYLGHSVSLSSDGSVIAVGIPYSDANGLYSGHVRVYENQSGSWIQIGNDIVGEDAIDNSGKSVSLSSDGSVIAIGAPYNDGNGDAAGHARIYENQMSTWLQIGNDLDGEHATSDFGISVSLSSDGSIVAIGAHNNGGGGCAAGHVRVFINSLVNINKNKNNFELSIFPNPTTSIITINAQNIHNVEVINLQGKLIYYGKDNDVDLSNESKGIYIVKVTTSIGVEVEKVILE